MTEIDFLQSRGVTELIHFTPATNLPSILANGIIPRNRLEQEGAEFAYADENRHDGKEHINLSITNPNIRIFFKFRKRMPDDFVILTLDTSILSKYKHSYTATNDASNQAMSCSVEELFSGNRPEGFRNNWTTDNQAEVLVDETISPEYILSVQFPVEGKEPSDSIWQCFNGEDTRLHWSRKYLDKAKQAYVEAGGTYTLSKSEEKAADFDANINAICKITFNICGYFGGYSTYIVELSEEMKAYTKLWEDEEPLLLLDDNEEPFTKNSYIAALKELHIGEWRRRYTTKRFGYMVLDGTQWELEFEYSNGHKSVRSDGDNSYPYNFDKLQMLIGIDNSYEDEDE